MLLSVENLITGRKRFLPVKLHKNRHPFHNKEPIDVVERKFLPVI